jgi:hypothetical protein
MNKKQKANRRPLFSAKCASSQERNGVRRKAKGDFGDYKQVGAMGRWFLLRGAMPGEYMMCVRMPNGFASSDQFRSARIETRLFPLDSRYSQRADHWKCLPQIFKD